MQRLLQNTAGTVTMTFLDASGAPANPSPPDVTVEILHSDGTTVVGAGTPATSAGSGVYTYALNNAQTAVLDRLTIRWSSADRTLTDYAEIAGGFLFTIAQAQALMPAATPTALAEARTYAETELESALGYALVPRYSRETITPMLRLGNYVRVRWPNIRAIRDIVVNGNALGAGELADLTVKQNFIVGWSLMTSNNWRSDVLVVGYEHGLDTPPSGANRAALALAADYLGGGVSGSSSIDPRAESIVTVDGTIRLRVGYGQFSAVGVNEWVAANRLPAVA